MCIYIYIYIYKYVVSETHVTKDVVIFGSHVTQGAVMSILDDQFPPHLV